MEPNINEQIKIKELTPEINWLLGEVGYLEQNRSVMARKNQSVDDERIARGAAVSDMFHI